MILDAQGFKTVLTPEAALGIVQKTVLSKGWKQFDVSDVKLVYTPYWVFSFDVLAGESNPTGKTALNAYTGELNDYVPYLIERPLKKVKETEEGAEAEVLPTAIAKSELSEVAATKVAAHAGIKKEMVSISAATKYYIPSFQIWVDAAGDSFKIDIDALLGNPQGSEAIPERPRGFSESAGETVKKLKSPSGWVELIGKTLAAVTGVVKPPAAGEGGGVAKSPLVRYALLALLVLALGYFVFFRTTTKGSVECVLNAQYYNPPEWFGLFGAKTVKPSTTPEGKLSVQGNCRFYNTGTDDVVGLTALNRIHSGQSIVAQNSSFVGILSPTGKTPTLKPFSIEWEGARKAKYYYSYCRIEECK